MADETETYRINASHQFYIPDDASSSIACVDVRFRHGVYWIASVSVDKKHRGHDLAIALINEALAHYGHHDLYLNVWAFNDQPFTDESLVTFYSRFGFVLIPEARGQMLRKATPKEEV